MKNSQKRLLLAVVFILLLAMFLKAAHNNEPYISIYIASPEEISSVSDEENKENPDGIDIISISQVYLICSLQSKENPVNEFVTDMLKDLLKDIVENGFKNVIKHIKEKLRIKADGAKINHREDKENENKKE